MIKKLKRFLKKPEKIFFSLGYRGLLNWMPDKAYLKLVFRTIMGKSLNLVEPQTYNEKLQWLKLYDRNPLYTQLADKYKVRKYIEKTIGPEYLIPLLGVWDKFEDIDFDALPDQFVLKCTHDSGGICICTDKKKFNIAKAKKKIKRSLMKNFYYAGREWPYKNIEPKIIAEKFMVDESETELKDYKFMCFNGKVKCSFVCTNRYSSSGINITFFDLDWNIMPFKRQYPIDPNKIKVPEKYDEMIKIAECLSKYIPFTRIDLYEVNGEIYFGEITFFPGSGFEKFVPVEGDKIFGDWLDLKDIIVK